MVRAGVRVQVRAVVRVVRPLERIKHSNNRKYPLKYASKPFFSYLRNKRKVKESVAALKREDDSVTVGGGETAEELSSFFSSVFTNESFGPLEEHCYMKSENYSEIRKKKKKKRGGGT